MSLFICAGPHVLRLITCPKAAPQLPGLQTSVLTLGAACCRASTASWTTSAPPC